MALNNGISVRLEPEIRERLEEIARRFGVKSSVLIRLAVLEKLESIETDSAIVFKVSGKRGEKTEQEEKKNPEAKPPSK